jgi:hypothetical protein
MRHATLLLAALLTTTTAQAQQSDLKTTPATVQAGSSVLLYPDEASDVFSPGVDLAARGRLGGSGEALPTLMFGFEYRRGEQARLYGVDVRLGYRTTGDYIFGIEGGMKIRHADLAVLSGQALRPVLGAYGAVRVGRLQLGPELTATVWDEATVSAGLRVSYVIGGSNQ